jgi:hypothetical protein
VLFSVLAALLALSLIPATQLQRAFATNEQAVSLISSHDIWSCEDEGASDTSVRHFRKDFTVENIADITKLEARIASSNGYVLSINGNEVSRSNMPADVVDDSRGFHKSLVHGTPTAPTSASIVGPDLVIAEPNQLITYAVSYNNLANSNAFDTTIEYNNAVLDFVSSNSIFESATFDDVSYPAESRVCAINGSSSILPVSDAEVVQFTFRAKQPVIVDDTTVRLVQADTVKRASATSNPAVITAALTKDAQTTALYSSTRRSPIPYQRTRKWETGMSVRRCSPSSRTRSPPTPTSTACRLASRPSRSRS